MKSSIAARCSHFTSCRPKLTAKMSIRATSFRVFSAAFQAKCVGATAALCAATPQPVDFKCVMPAVRAAIAEWQEELDGVMAEDNVADEVDNSNAFVNAEDEADATDACDSELQAEVSESSVHHEEKISWNCFITDVVCFCFCFSCVSVTRMSPLRTPRLSTTMLS